MKGLALINQNFPYGKGYFFCNVLHPGDSVGFPSPRRAWNELGKRAGTTKMIVAGDLEARRSSENCVYKGK